MPRDNSPICPSPFLTGTGHEVDVIQPVSYNPCSLDLTFISYRSSRARRAGCCSTRLTYMCVEVRDVVLGSPHRADDLQLVCTPATSTKATVDAWPAWPLLIQGIISSTSSVGNVVVALVRSTRICSIEFYVLHGKDKTAPVLHLSIIPHSVYISPPTRSSPPSLCCPASKHFQFNSNPPRSHPD